MKGQCGKAFILVGNYLTASRVHKRLITVSTLILRRNEHEHYTFPQLGILFRGAAPVGVQSVVSRQHMALRHI